jgi:hypothetical protein
MLLFLFVLWCITKTNAIEGTEEEVARYCIPIDLLPWDKAELSEQILGCLKDNFLKESNKTLINNYSDEYILTMKSKQQAKIADDHLYYSKRNIMNELRDMQLKTTHNAHAILKCADISKRIPNFIMTSIDQEGKYIGYWLDVWQHNVAQDIKHCRKILVNDMKKHNEHVLHHVQDSYFEYIQAQNDLQIIEKKHSNDKNNLQRMYLEIVKQFKTE